MKTKDFIQVEITSVKELREWLEKNHTQKESVWLVTYKKSTIEKYVARSDIIDILLCFGWVDGILRVLDDEKTMHFVSPRQTQYWTRMYKDRYAKLLKDGAVNTAGVAAEAKSKELGLWDFMDDVDDLIVPTDLEGALTKIKATTTFSDLNDSYKRNLLRYIKLAKTKPTRQKRIETIVNHTARGERIKNM